MINSSNQNSQEHDIAYYEKQIYDLKQLLEISKSLSSSILDLKKLIESILYICMCQMRTLSAGIFTQHEQDSNCFTLDSNYNGIELSPDVNYSIPIDHPAVCLLEKEPRPFTYDEFFDYFKKDSSGIESLLYLQPSLIIPLKAKSELNGILFLGERIDLGYGNGYSNYEREQILNIASLAAIAINNTQLIDQTTTDMMTHLKLKHYFFSVLSERLDKANIDHRMVSILMLDIDHFKQFNDTYGHACGDLVLQKIAETISNNTVENGLAARYGGEEFVVMLSDKTEEQTRCIAEKIRSDIENLDICYEENHLKVTISIGVSIFMPKEKISAKDLVINADTALYESKRAGRNKVTVYDSAMKIH